MIFVLVLLFIFSLFQLFIAIKLSKHIEIISHVASLDPEILSKHIPEIKQIRHLQNKLKLINGRRYFGLTIRQGITFAINMRRKEIHPAVKIEYLDRLTGIEFEMFLKELFEEKGYKVSMTPQSSDQGVDLILEKQNVKIAVQAKRFSQSIRVGNSAVQEVYAGKKYYDCSDGWIISTSTYSKQAIELATKVRIVLIDRKKLIQMIKT